MQLCGNYKGETIIRQSIIDRLFFLLAMILQQKRVDRLNIESTKKKKDITLLKFMQIKKLI